MFLTIIIAYNVIEHHAKNALHLGDYSIITVAFDDEWDHGEDY